MRSGTITKNNADLDPGGSHLVKNSAPRPHPNEHTSRLCFPEYQLNFGICGAAGDQLESSPSARLLPGWERMGEFSSIADQDQHHFLEAGFGSAFASQ